MKKTALFFTAAALALSSAAQANSFLKSPRVEKGEVEVELKGYTQFDDDAAKDGKFVQKLDLSYGLTDRLKLELEAELEHEEGDKTRYAATELEAIYQLTDQDEFGVDMGVLAAYELAANGGTDAAEIKLLLAKRYQHWDHLANFIVEHEVGQGAEGGVEGGIAWQSLYNLNHNANIGFEYFADFGQLDDTGGYSQQKHKIGPVATYHVPDMPVKMEIGYLVGVSRAAADGELKWELEFEF